MNTSLVCFIGVLAAAVSLIGSPQGDDWENWEDWEDWNHGDDYGNGHTGDIPYEGGDDPDNPWAVTDGSPQSTVAMMAREVAFRYAFLSAEAAEELAGGEDTVASAGDTAGEAAGEVSQSNAVEVDVGIGRGKIDGRTFNTYTLRVPYSRDVSDRGTLSVFVPLSITSIENILTDSAGVANRDARIYGGGLNLAYRHKVYMKADGVPYRWNITPTAGVFLRESSDLNQGAWVYNLGFSSNFAYRINPQWVVNLGNSVSFAWNSGRKDYPDPVRDNQQVIINGVQVYYLDGRWSHYGYVMDTRFLRSAFIDNYQTVGVGTSFKVTRSRSVRASLLYEGGSRFQAFRATVGSTWRF